MKTVPSNVQVVAHDELAGRGELPEELRVRLGDIAGVAREGLLALSVATGLSVMQAMFEAEVTAVAGPKGKHDPERTAVRHGTEKGSVTLGGRRVPVTRPRARTVNSHEMPLQTYAQFAADDLLGQVVLERMLAGVATRRHARIAEPVGQAVVASARSTGRSAVSRQFVKQTETALAELLARDLTGEDFKVLMLDGEHLADTCVVVALAITADGRKLPVGWVDAKLVKAFNHPDPELGLRNAKHVAGLLDKAHPGAASSLRERLEEMFTVSRLGIDGRLAKTLITSNPVESMISIARTTNRNVTRWRDGHMVLRWTAAGMLNAERSFRRIKGYKQMPQVVAALHRHAHPDTTAETPETVGAAA